MMLRRIATVPIRFYQYVISPWLGPNCRFQPTCSAYAIEALGRHGVLRGSWLALRRLSRCHPLGGHGYDPVPETRKSAATTAPSSHLSRRS